MDIRNIIIYSWLILLIIFLLAGIIYLLWENKEHYTGCIECCSDLRNKDFQKCREMCRTNGQPCFCCVLALKDKKISDPFYHIGTLSNKQNQETGKVLPRNIYLEQETINNSNTSCRPPRCFNYGSNERDPISSTLTFPTSVSKLPYTVQLPG